ncbi:Nitrogen regulation protein C [Salinivirga cyanobacteriivorans]|uniref:Nitrogen regulation protein C n=1 Tax=Salinivirga cyanobacteriivorans TaxID=1307839 RepID=A0A0S2HVY6_9BACT|nr:response regulator transcription factor [Salinivirga cyanobacteriivorans]ALO14222.1 Nitrogen regulation protein C [Salinivirga cyanobacteriivorans]
MNILQAFIVDDHSIFRQGLAIMLNKLNNVKVIGEAEDGKQFIDSIDKYNPDIVFLDIKMPNMDGIEAAELAFKKKPSLKIVVMTMFEEPAYLNKMVELGVHGFLLKNAEMMEIRKALARINEGDTYFSEDLLKKIRHTNTAEPKSNDISFSRREKEVLDYLCMGYSNNEIAEKLFISPRTVDGHRANLLSKTDSKNTVSLVLYAVKNKIVDLQ